MFSVYLDAEYCMDSKSTINLGVKINGRRNET
jgi:hypothetical protein